MTVKELKQIISKWDNADTIYIEDHNGVVYDLDVEEMQSGENSHIFIMG